jgi:hypothetical protein
MKKLLILTLLISQYTFADSPLTSTEFYKAYLSVTDVLEASTSNGTLTDKHFNFLNDKENNIGEKIALINALKWNIKGKKNAKFYIKKLFASNKKYTSKNFYKEASADELICYAYLKAMDDYFDVNMALTFSKKALEKNPTSSTIHIVYQLINAQTALHNQNWCQVYTLFQKVALNKSLNKDFNLKALKVILNYTNGYKKYC